MSVNRPIVLFVPSFSHGGVERMLVNLAEGLVEAGRALEIWVNRDDWSFLKDLPKGIVVGMGTGREMKETAVRRLQSVRPALILASKEENCLAALDVRSAAGISVPLVFRAASDHGARLQGRGFIRKWKERRTLRSVYRGADHVIAVSRGVADRIVEMTGVSPARVSVLPNPVVHPRLLRMSLETVDHRWVHERQVPLILGIGRLCRAKNFDLLIDAFAEVRRQRPCRLLILGEGKDRQALEGRARRLGLADDVELAGFTDNPYAYLARADLFVLSSSWEGSPNALTEALALGVPAVSTDCPSGPRELLAGGQHGLLVPPGNVAAMAEAIRQTLDNPLPSRKLQEAVAEFSVENSVRRYLDVFDLVIAFHERAVAES